MARAAFASLEDRQRYFRAGVSSEIETMRHHNPTLADATGATAHMLAKAHDSGKEFLLVGHDLAGREIRFTARSFVAVVAYFRAVAGLERAWQIIGPARRRMLVFSRDGIAR